MNTKKISIAVLLVLLAVILPSGIFAAPGDLDLSFGQNGVVNTAIGANGDYAQAVAVQTDGKIVAVGAMTVSQGQPIPRAAIVRYNFDGTLDTSFAGGGKTFISTGIWGKFYSVVIQPDGKILAGGYISFNGRNSDFLVCRYNSNGTLDTSFGSIGIASTGFGVETDEISRRILLQPDGKILAFGSQNSAGGTIENFALIRYNPNGTLDTSFDGDGIVFTSFASRSGALRGIIQPDGKIIAGGSASSNGISGFALARYGPNGALDSSFGDGGKLLTTIGNANSLLSALVLQSSGKIVAVGSNDNGISNTTDFVLVRYNPNGALDSSFGSGGIVRTDIDNSSNSAKDAVIQSNDKITVLGAVNDPNTGKLVLARYDSDGILDAGFGQGGIVQHFSLYHEALAIQTDGKLVTAGLNVSFPYKFQLARYSGDVLSNRYFDFDGDGKSDISVFRGGVWHLQRSQFGFAAVTWGIASDKPAPADFDGDGKTDLTVYRPSTGEWSVFNSFSHTISITYFGAADDLPRPADYDGDGKADICVFRPSNGMWYRLNSSNGQFAATAFGQSGDVPLIADFDGDGKSDIAVFRPSNGVWYWLRSSDGQIGAVAFGANGDKPAAADYDGDGKTDIAVFRPSNGIWYLQQSTVGFAGIAFGAGTDLPVPADYDGDGKIDVSVFRPSNGVWYLNRSTQGFTGIVFGASGDKPIPNAFIP